MLPLRCVDSSFLVDGSSGPNAWSGVHAEYFGTCFTGTEGQALPTNPMSRRRDGGFFQEGKFEMRKAFEIGGLVAGLVLGCWA